MKREFLDQMDTMFLVEEAKIMGKGEDSFCCMVEDDCAMVAVFDGCGGSGAQTYKRYQGHTGAYIASRLMSGAIHDWFVNCHGKKWASEEELLCSIDSYFKKNYGLGNQFTDSDVVFMGTLMRTLPTTAAIAFATQENGKIILHSIWAGDSRVYLLNQNGLIQITRDDAGIDDAFENLVVDSPLTNVLSSDRKYTLNAITVVLEEPAIVLAATDGCFGYYDSPMEFEYMLLDDLVQSNSIHAYKHRLHESMSAVAQDDFALGVMSFHYGDFDEMRNEISIRREELYRRFISPIAKQDDHQTRALLWRDYRTNYESYLNENRRQ